MREKNHHNSVEEFHEQERVERRHVKKNPKMIMTGKGMKRFAVLKSGGAGSGSAGKPKAT